MCIYIFIYMYIVHMNYHITPSNFQITNQYFQVATNFAEDTHSNFEVSLGRLLDVGA